ncbi:MAG: hypothetical protein IPQ09_09040 [Myxococcales bacterium]|nr:hypothetical protein [Myxococcales bacterium]HQY61474.1 hypothetical protein [Polyangiaceae bacterium]
MKYRPLSSLSSRASLGLLVALAACTSSEPPGPTAPPPAGPTPLAKGEICEPDNSAPLKLRFDPARVIVAPGASRPVTLTVDPDLCSPVKVTFKVKTEGVRAPETAIIDLRKPSATFDLQAVSAGATALTAVVERPSPSSAGQVETATAELPIDVRDGTPPTCAPGEGAGQGTLSGASPKVTGAGALASAALSSPATAFARTDEFALPSFGATVACAKTPDLTAGSTYGALGPAVSFEGTAPVTSSNVLRREVDFALPINPAALPSQARMRHVEVLYQGPRAKTPRAVPVANPRVEAEGAGYVLRFSAPWLGTYQVVARKGAGEGKVKRRLTHRAVLGFSMGAGGSASFGLRHHDKFDAVAPLGGLADYTWLTWFIDAYALGGFCPTSNPNCTKYEPGRYPFHEPFAHSMDYNHFWYEEGNGNGGSFPRHEYAQIFGDLALAFGNLASENRDPALSHMVAGPTKNDPWIKGDLSGVAGAPAGLDCSFSVSPVKGDKDNALQRTIAQACAKFRCDPKNQWKAPANYFDDEYNPDGTKPVITFCDGGQEGVSPYKNTFMDVPSQHTEPVNFAVAVDLNGNGLRDKDEPVIRSGHEPWDDCGADGLCDKDEPGYDPVQNPDPNQDDYDYMLSPGGAELNHHYDKGEKFRDDGLDGVPNTKDRHVAGDPGEGDGVYSEASGHKNVRRFDAHSIVARWTSEIPGGELTDPALKRLDIITDGGVRDLFNFASVGNHLAGAVGSRKDGQGRQLKSVAFYNGYEYLPGQDPARPIDFAPSELRWADIVDMPNVRYGAVDATKAQILLGDGQHVGTAAQLLNRLLFGFYYVAQRWPDADRTRSEVTIDKPSPEAAGPFSAECLQQGRCEHFFTGPKTKRTGPIAVTLPPGYAHADNKARDVRYPVVYVLHGYGQDPRDLEAVALVTNNFMNDGTRSSANRLPKFIVVYVDGRCRSQDGRPECIQGSFYVDSSRPGGPQFDAWFDEVIDLVDASFRTMKPSEVEIPD